MKYITSCPQCDTHFFLNDELIAAYEGKVQCGSCSHVFNAKDRLAPVGDDTTSPDAYKAKNENPAASTTGPIISNTPTAEKSATATSQKPAIEAEAKKAPTPTPTPTPTPSPSPSPSPSQDKASEDDNANVDYVIGKPTSETAAPKNETVAPDVVLNLDALNSKSKNAQKPTFLSILISLLLILLFIFLATFFLRGKIAAKYPQLKPSLERVCEKLNCTIDLPQNLEFISIGDSDMQEDDAYQSVINFSSSLQNNADYSQAYPSIELTLTDSDDTPVIKKLIKPEAYLGAKEKLAQGMGPHEIANIKIALRVDDPTVASYRILLLY